MEESTPSAVNLINFLQFEFEANGKQYRTLNTYRSAVSTTLGTCPVRGSPVGQDPLVCRFMRGLLRLRPPKTKLFPTWDLVTVLNRSLTLLQLLKKTAFLVAVVCYKRPADLCNMQVVPGYWQLDESGFTCQPLGFGKTEQHRPVPPIKIEPFQSNPNLCPVLHMCNLERRLVKFRPQSVKQFWITSRRPFKAISPITMSRWLQDVILDAGFSEGSARDVRSVGSSTAVQTNMDIGKVMEAANWQRLSTMQRHYFKPQCLQSLSGILNVTSGVD